MDIRQAPVNPYQNPRAHHLQHSQALPHPPAASFAPSYVPQIGHHVHQQQYFRQHQGVPRAGPPPSGLTSSFPPPNNQTFVAASPNTVHYQQQFSLPVHNPVPLQRPQPVLAPQQQIPVHQVTVGEGSSGNQEPKQDKHLKGLKYILEPPDKEIWREKLFNVDGMVVLTEEQYALRFARLLLFTDFFGWFQTYFPHVDNVYSHRSTQDYKKKPFLSHYYDCRLKGRPAGTPKSDDPNKKKRKRVARERDLCDVKIKITEYLPGATRDEIATHLNQQPRADGISAEDLLTSVQGAIGQSWTPTPFEASAKAVGRFYTIQRVNGTGPNASDIGSMKHRHSLYDSDRIKKNSVIRSLVKVDKQKKNTSDKKSYHTKATGQALATAKKHSNEHSLKLYGSCFCPFVQRVWISLEIKKMPYQYLEIDPYKKPDWYLKINPRGLVPSLQDGDWVCYESTVLMEYLEDLGQGQSLLPSDPKLRAHSRLWSDHINRKIIPKFYNYLQAQEPDKQAKEAGEFKEEIEKLVNAADPEGPFFMGREIGFVDVQFAPWVIRLNKVLKPYRGWPEPDPNSRWAKWIAAIESNESVKATTSTDELYMDSYERYAENRPNTSQVANAVNSGGGLP